MMFHQSTWEIGIGTDDAGDPTVKELPHIIKVTNVKFIPIHTFVPQLFNGITQKGKIYSLNYRKCKYRLI